MSYHILHLTTPNIKLYTEKGFLFCKFQDETENKLPIDDIRAIIVATHQVSFTNSCLARLLENSIVILHCNNSYKPVGWSMALDKIVRTKAFFNQISQNKEFENALWKILLKTKIQNQINVLDYLRADITNLTKLSERPLISEGNIARIYWNLFFNSISIPQKREHQNAENYENICLNYGYAVFQSLLYRSIIIHGLLANLGIHHEEKYNSTPLVYDLIEPFRAFVDYYLCKFKEENIDDFIEKNLLAWNKYLAFCLKNYRLKANGMSYKIIDYVDIYVETVANAFIKFDTDNLVMPNLKEQYLHIDKHRNREYEE